MVAVQRPMARHTVALPRWAKTSRSSEGGGGAFIRRSITVEVATEVGPGTSVAAAAAAGVGAAGVGSGADGGAR